MASYHCICGDENTDLPTPKAAADAWLTHWTLTHRRPMELVAATIIAGYPDEGVLELEQAEVTLA